MKKEIPTVVDELYKDFKGPVYIESPTAIRYKDEKGDINLISSPYCLCGFGDDCRKTGCQSQLALQENDKHNPL